MIFIKKILCFVFMLIGSFFYVIGTQSLNHPVDIDSVFPHG